MCLSITLKSNEPVQGAIEKQFGDGTTLYIAANRTIFRQKNTDQFNVSDLPGGKACACGLLGDNADFEGDGWVLNESALPLLEETLKRFKRLVNGAFSFTTSWSKESIESVVDLRLADILVIVNTNQIAKRTEYRIR
jgi:hypothetical protein